MNIFKKNAQGFTLIELIVVISVIGILSVIAIPRLSGMQDKAEDANIAMVAGSIRTAMEVYYQDNDSYPATEDINSWDDLKSVLNVLDLTESVDYNIETDSLTYETGDPLNEYEFKVTSSASGQDYSITHDNFGLASN